MTEENTPFRHLSSFVGRYTGDSEFRTASIHDRSSFLGYVDVSSGMRDMGQQCQMCGSLCGK